MYGSDLDYGRYGIDPRFLLSYARGFSTLTPLAGTYRYDVREIQEPATLGLQASVRWDRQIMRWDRNLGWVGWKMSQPALSNHFSK